MHSAAETQDAAAAAAAEQQQRERVEAELADEDLDRMMAERVAFEPEVENFLRELYDKLYIRDADAIRRLYEVEYPAITEKYFAASPWPSVELVGDFYREYQRYHSLIMTLYKELYYRHLFLKCPELATWEHRRDSWNNYALLVEFLADTTCAKDRETITLPLQWLWDMLDEFVYQFQESSRWLQRKCKTLADSPDRKRLIAELEARVFELLQKTVQQSGIREQLQQQRSDPAAAKAIETDLGLQLGYFALILQLKLHVQVGLFYAGVAAVKEMDLSPKAFYWRVPVAHYSFVFHLGFAYMMLRRYHDAIRLMSQALLALSRQRGQLAGSNTFQGASMTRSADRMHVLLLLCSKLCGVKLDDSIHQTIKERHSDKYYRLQQDTEEAYCELFTWAAPRFIDPSAPPTYDDAAFERFVSGKSEIRDVESRRRVNTINSFTKLYHNIPLAKLGRLMGESGEEAEWSVRGGLMNLKMQSQQKMWKGGVLTSGDVGHHHADALLDFKVEGDMLHVKVNVKVEGDMLHVKNQQTQQEYVDQLVMFIEKTDSLMNAVQHAVVAPAPQLQQQQQQQQQQQDASVGARERRKPQTAY
ncbi:eukaryotic translation initiation factor 3 subunit 6 interacting protein, putative [Eimeria acervulina]|uniref:Eukaryotic translation initiation factor 3 subunit L n=1 Tax=Eimeria acervulina TaxID=5801 RepID=U6GQR3_EIMAC|nr:eukaryotic translation initiation factor 3 subunit 6 interacting protein, putative [Eimeria acervulina]CDI80959.1 eukaryotic translation initiation factor 3 subunit 6 interacting protein, putative [Eimeria acervulina]